MAKNARSVAVANSEGASELSISGTLGFADRLKELIGDEPANRFARKVGLGESLLRKYLTGAVPGIDKVALIASATGTRLDWLVYGSGERESRAGVPARSLQGTSALGVVEGDGAELTLIPRLDVYASAGHGAVQNGEDVKDFIAFSREWLRSHKINPDYARILTARGDSMEETIRNGDLLIIDTALDFFRDNGIYVIGSGEMVLVKRVHRRSNGSCQLISDNPRYPTEELTSGEAEQLHIAGRVMWYGRSI